MSGYGQLPVHGDLVDKCGIVTPRGVSSSTRVLQGLTNASPHFQRIVELLFRQLRNNLKAWLDGFNLHARIERDLLGALEAFFKVFHETGMFLSIRKSVFFAKSIKWCGRFISADGYEMGIANSQSLGAMEILLTADELAQFIYRTRWMARSIPDFSR